MLNSEASRLLKLFLASPGAPFEIPEEYNLCVSQMPYTLRKNPNQKTYNVKNAKTGTVHSYHATKAKAEAPVRLLMSLEKASRTR
jgi:hypothetical protein